VFYLTAEDFKEKFYRAYFKVLLKILTYFVRIGINVS